MVRKVFTVTIGRGYILSPNTEATGGSMTVTDHTVEYVGKMGKRKIEKQANSLLPEGSTFTVLDFETKKVKYEVSNEYFLAGATEVTNDTEDDE